MAQWHCTVGGKQFGPVEREILLQWAAEGRLSPGDLVWSEGMDSWQPAATMLTDAHWPLNYAAPAYRRPGQTPIPAHGGTGGQTPNGTLCALALDSLRENWGLAIGFCVLVGLFTVVLGCVPYLGGIIQLLLTGPITVGRIIFFLTLTRRGKPEIGQMFQGFQNFGNVLGAYLLVALFTFLWMLLLIVPGIIKGLAYSQTLYLLADNPDMGVFNAIERSQQLMNGNKAKLFLLGLRFFGWSLLCLLTLGIGFLWLVPYMSAAYAQFYDDLQPAAYTM